MISRTRYVNGVKKAIGRSPVTAILGPRQCGKTTLAKFVCNDFESTYLDLESRVTLRRLENPEMLFASLSGLVVIDEIQLMPELFSTLRVVVDDDCNKCRFLILGSASPHIVKGASETLAGRIEFIDMRGFDSEELEFENTQRLWLRGGFPRSYLAGDDNDSYSWRNGFIRTFLERDIPQLGIKVPAPMMQRFWTMLAHFHGKTWNASSVAASLGISYKTVQSYLDILTQTFMIRQLQPWHENIKKRQVKSPKIYFCDSGLLHNLLEIRTFEALLGNPQCGASWEGFAVEQVLRMVGLSQAYFWATHNGAELDMFFIVDGKRYGIEFKLNEAPSKTKSMSIAVDTLGLDKLLVVYPGSETWQFTEKIIVSPLEKILDFMPK
ncbi:MAG: ATP-binding protein [Sedimentisphaeraceae bacterium JB056]